MTNCPGRHASATLLASTWQGANQRMRHALRMGSAKVLSHTDNSGSGRVPNVHGLGVRDAIRRLEDAGLCVRISGSGYVDKQSIEPGQPIKQGDIIQLTLKQ